MRCRDIFKQMYLVPSLLSRSIFTKTQIRLFSVDQRMYQTLWRRYGVSMRESESENSDDKDMGKANPGIFNSLFDFVKQDLQKSSLFSKNNVSEDHEVDSDFENGDTLYLKKTRPKEDVDRNVEKPVSKEEDMNNVEMKEYINECVNMKEIKEEKLNIDGKAQKINECTKNINPKEETSKINNENSEKGSFYSRLNFSNMEINKRHFESRIFSDDNLKEAPVTKQKAKPQSTQSSVDVYRGVGSYWERFYSILRSSPIIDKFVKAKQEFNETEIGEQITDMTENIRQKWETSQHPIVYRLSYYYHKLFSLSERDQCIKIARVTDPSFNIPEFKIELEENTYPAFVKAFLGSDSETLQKVCSQECFEQLDAFIRLRKADGLSAKNNVYQVSNVTFLKSFRLGGSPVFIYSGIVMQDNCIYDKSHNVVVGGESEVNEMVYIMAVQQILNEETHKMTWKIIELSFQELNF